MNRYRWYRFFILFTLLALPVPVAAASVASLVAKGNSAYEAKNFDAALEAYDQALAQQPDASQIYFNKGAAYFRKGALQKAKDAWQKAALHTRNLSLEAKALFNLGNLSFAEANRQKENDLQQSIEDCRQSATYYQQSLDLLKKEDVRSDRELQRQAAENIEMVRRAMQSLMDELQKQQKQQQQQKEAAKRIQQIIGKQRELNDRNQSNLKEKMKTGGADQIQSKATHLANEQQRLRMKTKTADNMLQNQEQSEPVKTAKQHLKLAAEDQSAAAEQMKSGDLAEAGQRQQAALKHLTQALVALNPTAGEKKQANQPTGTGQKSRSTGKQTAGRETTPQELRASQPSDSLKAKNEQQTTPFVQLQDDANRILGEEKENLRRRRSLFSSGTADVDKDW
jgi:tetratricopeptide (TPR) repeat protein